MKTTIVIEDTRVQVVLTPETDWESKAINILQGKQMQTEIFKGNFSECVGGYMRDFRDKDSLMIYAKEPVKNEFTNR